MSRHPMRPRWYLRPVTWLISFPNVWRHRTRIERVGVEGLKPPYLLLCNHNAFYDFMVATAAIFPHRANYVVAIDGFIGREWLMRRVGCICKRKFTTDTVLARQLRRVVEHGDIAAVYPEARYSLCGTDAVLPQSLGKLAKFLKVPVVTLITHGNHINSPFWHPGDRGVRTVAEFRLLMSAEETAEKSVTEINTEIRKRFEYDDFAWQRENRIRVACADRAEGLHKVLYQCPCCKTEYKMASRGAELFCEACGKRWVMSEYGELSAVEGVTEFSHIPDWYEWERAQVRDEVERGVYRFDAPVNVFSLPNSRGYIPLGEGRLVQDAGGFHLSGVYNGEPYEMKCSAESLYSCHIEYDYLGKYGDCVDLNSLTDTYYIYPKDCLFSVTKLALATEELHQFHARKTAQGLR